MAQAPVQSELTIDELAQRTGMTVRNIRAHQSRGLLPPPEVRARTGYYGPEHVARLQLIRELQDDGFNLKAIERLLESSSAGAVELLGFKRELLAPFGDEQPEIVETRDLVERFGVVEPKLAAKVERLGVLIPLGGGRWEVPSPTLMKAGADVVELGVPLEAVIDVLERLDRHAAGVAETFVKVFVRHVWEPFEAETAPEERDAALADVRAKLERLRPLASEALGAAFTQAMNREAESAFGKRVRGK
jgi:DNA-binding transcriptional MerR regulator